VPVFISKNIKPLLNPNDIALSQKIGNLVSGACVTLKTIQKDLVVELLLRYLLSNSLDHSNSLVFIRCSAKEGTICMTIPFFSTVCRENFDIPCTNLGIHDAPFLDVSDRIHWIDMILVALKQRWVL
jgi:hypothetical protein